MDARAAFTSGRDWASRSVCASAVGARVRHLASLGAVSVGPRPAGEQLHRGARHFSTYGIPRRARLLSWSET